MKKQYLILSLILLVGCAKSNGAEEPTVNVKTVVIEQPQTKIDIAKQYLDYSAKKDRQELKEFIGVDPLKIEWCAAFINAVLHHLGLPGSESVSDYPLVARSFLTWGKVVREPQQGDIVVFPRGKQPWQGHVGFYYGTVFVNGKKYYQILGGNQSKRVTIELFPARAAIGIRRHLTN